MPIDPFSNPPPTLVDQYKVLEPSILFTLNDLRVIRNYVDSHGRLPVSPESIAKSFNTSVHTLGPLMLKAITDLNEAVIAHVQTWPKLQEESISLGAELEKFSISFIATLERLTATIKSTPAWSRFSVFEEVEDVSLPTELFDLSADDESAVLTLGQLLDYLGQQVDAYLSRVTEVHHLAISFRDAITYGLEGHIEHAFETLSAFAIDDQISDLKQNIEDLKKELASEQSKLEYFESVIERSWAGSLLGRAIGELIVGNSRKDAEDTIATLVKKITHQGSNLDNLNPFKARLVEYAVTLSNLDVRLDAVVKASNKLLSVWREVKANIGESKKQLSFVTRQEQLSLLELKFRNASVPWQEICNNARELNALFKTFSKEEQPLLQQGIAQ